MYGGCSPASRLSSLRVQVFRSVLIDTARSSKYFVGTGNFSQFGFVMLAIPSCRVGLLSREAEHEIRELQKQGHVLGDRR
jgi:hypothetical protein